LLQIAIFIFKTVFKLPVGFWGFSFFRYDLGYLIIDLKNFEAYNKINILEITYIMKTRRVQMSNMGNQLVSNVFKALAHPTRIQIVKLLKVGELCVCNILPKLDSEQSNTSQHLTIMKNQGIVESRKDGSKVIYAIKNKEVLEMIKLAEAMILRQIEETKTSFKYSD